ncbi:MAG TPA: glycosyltransferase [Paludibacteraceae bacterium]|nr:glycosyltransferase [Paludibacteraceae bacterium]
MKQNKRIVFLNFIHYSLDDRIFYHQAKSLSENGFEVFIFSLKEDFQQINKNITIDSIDAQSFSQKDKLKTSISFLTRINPQLIICDAPLAVFAAFFYRIKNNLKAKVLYDVTEWYPSKKNIRNLKGFIKFIKTSILLIINIMAGLLTSAFIFGEYYKSLPFRILYFWKLHRLIPYYPDHKYIKQYPNLRSDHIFKITYTGIISREKGIDHVLHSLALVANDFPDIVLNLQIIADFPTGKEKDYFQNLISQLPSNVLIDIKPFQPFLEFCKQIGDTNVFLDLREKNFENNHCLPIKLFYYLACGRPVIYSDLKAIKKEIYPFNFGYLVSPSEHQIIAKYLEKYLIDYQLYYEHSANALRASEKKFRWDFIKDDFISFIKNFIKL